ncbi:hypothetical protein [Cerasicoccus fimbriatus]|uniref:hypothetical protein n=1 Tax=Cerasicoccus fimbriatus TaxID=3014554 RepID=UPI0022B37554|nr:hypothetical protein [Cerasicoccus sp. TK19100]
MTKLIPINDHLAWHTLPWPAFQADSLQLPKMAIQPVCALLANKPDQPLNFAEQSLWQSLNHALHEIDVAAGGIRILPAFRHVPNIVPGVAFGTSLPNASRTIMEIAQSVHRSNVAKIAFVHSNSALGDWLDTIARELRIQTDMQVFNLFLDPDAQSSQPSLANILREALNFPPITPYTPEAQS